MTERIRAILVCLAAVGMCAAGTWKENGKPVPDTSWAKSDGEFGAELVFTDKPDEFFAAWEKPGPAILLSETPTAVRGGAPIVGVILFAGCAPNERGMCEVTVDFQAYTSDGKPWGDPQHGEVWLDKPPPDPGQLQLSVGNLGLLIEAKDPLGEYKVRADVLDKVARKRMTLERSFAAIEGAGEK